MFGFSFNKGEVGFERQNGFVLNRGKKNGCLFFFVVADGGGKVANPIKYECHRLRACQKALNRVYPELLIAHRLQFESQVYYFFLCVLVHLFFSVRSIEKKKTM